MAISALCAKAILRKGKARYAGPKSSAKRGTIIGEAWNRYRSSVSYANRQVAPRLLLTQVQQSLPDSIEAQIHIEGEESMRKRMGGIR